MRAWYENLAEREKRFVLIGGVGAILLLILGVVLPLNRNIAQARHRVELKQADLAYIQSVAPELANAGPMGGSGESLVVLVDSSARESGLGKSLSNSQPTGQRSRNWPALSARM